MNKKKLLMIIITFIFCVSAFVFSLHNEAFYKTDIAKIISVKNSTGEVAEGDYGEKEQYINQDLGLKLMNGIYKGRAFDLQSIYGYSQIKTTKYETGDEVFVKVYNANGSKAISILSAKRDYMAVAFLGIMIMFLVIIASGKGLLTLLGMIVNSLIFIISMILYMRGVSMLILMLPMIILFSLATLFIVNGIDRKTLTVALSTLVTVLAMAVIYTLTDIFTPDIPYYMDDYLVCTTAQLKMIFLCSVLIGSMGAIMDVSMVVCTGVSQIYRINGSQKSVLSDEVSVFIKAVGADITGIMQNVLLFSYLSGTIVIMLLKLKTGYYITNLLKYDFSFEIVRFLMGAIGIAITVPITGIVARKIYSHKRREGMK